MVAIKIYKKLEFVNQIVQLIYGWKCKYISLLLSSVPTNYQSLSIFPPIHSAEEDTYLDLQLQILSHQGEYQHRKLGSLKNAKSDKPGTLDVI